MDNTGAEVSDVEKVPISLGNVLDYIGDSIRPLREGQNVFDSEHIVCIGHTHKTSSLLTIQAYVLQSSHPADIPHHLELKIGSDYRQWTLKCSCKAGTARCKHIVACLLHLCQFGFVEHLTCTDSRQAWGKSKTNMTSLWRAKPVEELCCIRKHPKLDLNAPNKEVLLEQAFKRILQASPNSAIKKHIEGRELSCQMPTSGPLNRLDHGVYVSRHELHDMISINTGAPCTTSRFDHELLPENLRLFYENVVVKDTQSILDICDDTKDQQNNAWYLHRSIRITASSCYDLFTYTRNKNADWPRKIQQYLNPKPLHLKALEYGKQTEELALNCYKRKRNPLVNKCGFVVCRSNPWIGASPDGIDSTCRLLLEIKCPTSGEDHDLNWISDQCKATKAYLKRVDSSWVLNRKHKYVAQVQMCMYVTGCIQCDFVVYSKYEDDFIVIDVDYDENYVSDLISSLKQVYFNHMLQEIVRNQINQR